MPDLYSASSLSIQDCCFIGLNGEKIIVLLLMVLLPDHIHISDLLPKTIYWIKSKILE